MTLLSSCGENQEQKLKILREKEKAPLDFEIVRQIIVSKGIKTEIFNGEIGYLRLSSFQSNSTANVRKAIYDLRKKTGEYDGSAYSRS